MRLRTLWLSACLLGVVHCGNGETTSKGGGPNDAGEGGDAGEGTSGSGGTRSGASGSGQGGSSGAIGASGDGGASGASGASGEVGDAGESGSPGTGGASGQGGMPNDAGASGESGAGGGSEDCPFVDLFGRTETGEDSAPETVSGYVTLTSGAPNPCAAIGIGSVRTVTDANGFFQIPNVAPEYDLTLVSGDEVLVVRGVTTRSLNLVSGRDQAFEDIQGEAEVNGVVSDIGVPADPSTSRNVQVVYEGSGNSAYRNVTLSQGNPSYALGVNWEGVANVAGFLYAIGFDTGPGSVPTGYYSFGSKPLSLQNGETYGDPNGSTPETTIALSPVGARTLSGTLTVPAGYSSRLLFDVGPFTVYGADAPAGPYSIELPTGITAVDSWALILSDSVLGESSRRWTRLADSTATLDLTAPAAPTLLLPEADATGIDHDTVFSWDPSSSLSIALFFFDAWRITVVTPDSSEHIPDLSEFGVVPAPGSEMSWRITNVFEISSVEQWIEHDADFEAYLNANGRYGDADSLSRSARMAE